MTGEISTDVCVVGGGPAGMAFALALAMRGDNVVVLEKSADFERSFRGESLSPDAVRLSQRLGVLEQLREQRIIEVAATELMQDGELLMRVNFADYDSQRLPIEVPQPMLLRTLADAAAVHPHFRLVRSAGATELLRSGGKVTGVRARTPDGQIEVSARLTVGADGRYSNVLDWSGLAVRKLPMNRDALWLGSFKSTWLFAARDEFILEPDGEETKLRQREYFSGILVLLLKRTLARTEEGFHVLNQALKQRAETAAGVRRVE